MPQGQVRVLPVRDFSGGLNLRDDSFQLHPNESDDLLNVDLMPSGGVRRRKTVVSFNQTPLSAVPSTLFSFPSESLVLAQVGSSLAYSYSGGSFTELASASPPLSDTFSGRFRGAIGGRLTGSKQNREYMYLSRGATQTTVAYPGVTGGGVDDFSTVRTLADAHLGYNEDLTVPAGGRFPVCSYVCFSNGFMFVADTLEGTGRFENRVRWSHPGEPEDWRSLDFVDVQPNDGDVIVGLAPFRDSLIIFKQRSVHVLSGYSSETFQLSKVSSDLGATAQESIAAGPFGVAFFDGQRGAYLYDGQFKWLWPKLQPKLQDNTINAGLRSGVTLGWCGPRLYVSVPWESGSVNGRTFVWDVRVGDGWTAHDYGVGPLVDFTGRYLACNNQLGYIVELEYGDTYDSLSGLEFDFDSHFTTAWLDAGTPGVKKRWRRPKLILGNDNSYTMSILGWKDYDLSRDPNAGSVVVQGVDDYTVMVESGGSGSADAYDAAGAYDEALGYDTGATDPVAAVPFFWDLTDWDQSYWSVEQQGSNVIKVGPTLGRAMAVRLKFSGSRAADWRLDAIQVPFVQMRVK